MTRRGTARRRRRATAATVARMKSILRATLAGAIAAGVFSALLRRQVARQAEAFQRFRTTPLTDAEPDVEEPLQESDLRVAQNSPL